MGPAGSLIRLLLWQLIVPKGLQEETAGSLQGSAENLHCITVLHSVGPSVIGRSRHKRRGSEKIIKECAAIFNPTHRLKLVVSLPLKAGIGAPGWFRLLSVCLTSAQVMISWFVGSSSASDSVLTAWSLEPVWDSVSASLSLPLLCSCSLSLFLSFSLS